MRTIEITFDEAEEIINDMYVDMYVSDNESQANMELMSSIASKIVAVYPELSDKCEELLKNE